MRDSALPGEELHAGNFLSPSFLFLPHPTTHVSVITAQTDGMMLAFTLKGTLLKLAESSPSLAGKLCRLTAIKAISGLSEISMSKAEVVECVREGWRGRGSEELFLKPEMNQPPATAEVKSGYSIASCGGLGCRRVRRSLRRRGERAKGARRGMRVMVRARVRVRVT